MIVSRLFVRAVHGVRTRERGTRDAAWTVAAGPIPQHPPFGEYGIGRLAPLSTRLRRRTDVRACAWIVTANATSVMVRIVSNEFFTLPPLFELHFAIAQRDSRGLRLCEDCVIDYAERLSRTHAFFPVKREQIRLRENEQLRLRFRGHMHRAWRRVAIACALTTVLSCKDHGRPVIAVVAPMPSPEMERIFRAHFEGDTTKAGSIRLVFAEYTQPSEAELPVLQAERLVALSGLVGVAGHESSRSSLQAAPAYEDKGVVQIVPTGTSNKLSTVSPWTFPLVSSDSIQGELIAKYLMHRRFTRVAVFVQDDEYGRDVLAELRRVLLGSDVNIVDDITLVPNSDISLLVQSALSQNPQLEAFVTIAQENVAISIGRESWALRPKLTLVGSDAVTGSPALAALAPSREQLAIVTYWLPDTTAAATREYIRTFTTSVGRKPNWADAATYDAVGLLVEGAKASGNSPTAVRAWLKSLGKDIPPYHGILGLIDFNGKHRIAPLLVSPAPDGWRPVQ